MKPSAQPAIAHDSALHSEPSRSVGEIDFTIMYATHDALRRDLGRLTAAVDADRGIGLRAGWDNFKAQLFIHHSVEDGHLWPKVRAAVDSRAGHNALLDEMESEHAALEPLIDAVDYAFTTRAGGFAHAVQELSTTLVHHLDHEERDGLALVQATLTPSDWREFAGQMRRRQGIRGAATYVPWVLDQTPKAKQQRFLAALPPPVRLVNRLVWQRRYRHQHLWVRS